MGFKEKAKDLKEKAKKCYRDHKKGCQIAAVGASAIGSGIVGYLLGKSGSDCFTGNCAFFDFGEDTDIDILNVEGEDGNIGFAVIEKGKANQAYIGLCDSDGSGPIYENIGD